MGAPSQVLVSAKWLSDMVKRNLVGPRLRVLDTSWYLPMMKRDGRKEFAQAHIAGASFFDIDECVDPASKFDHTLPSPDIFADYVGNLGVGNNSHVVVYDASDFGSFTCTRVWWMFRFFGHSNVSVLNGGLRNWVREGHPITAAHGRPERARFTATRNHPSWVKSFEDVTRNIREQEFQVVDVRPHERFRGKEPEPREGKFLLLQASFLYYKLDSIPICVILNVFFCYLLQYLEFYTVFLGLIVFLYFQITDISVMIGSLVLCCHDLLFTLVQQENI